MSSVHDPLAPVAARLSRMFGLEARLARAVAAEVVDALDRSVEDYIDERHHELKRAALTNDVIFATIQRELRQLRFAAPPLTERQIRRRIYG